MSLERDSVLIKYNIEEIFKCQDENCVMMKDLEYLCSNKYKYPKLILNELMNTMDEITKLNSKGIDPNDIALKNTIRDCLFKINNNNYASILEDLKTLNYTCEGHCQMLATELIVKSMNDVMGSKGIESLKSDQKTPSEIYVSVAKEFSNYMIGENDIKFRSVLSVECKRIFDKLTDKNERMDHNNPHRNSNYKGFMNMIGLMYVYGIFPKDIVKLCFNKILVMILNSGLSQDECDNYYSGYERLMNRLLTYFEREAQSKNKEINQTIINQFNDFRDYIKEINDKISNACNGGDDVVKPIRKFSIITHQHNVNRFNKLCSLYPTN